MFINNANTHAASKRSENRFALRATCLFALTALFLLLVLLAGCAQAGTGANVSPSPSATAEQGPGNAGFVIEDTVSVDVEIDGE
jgi:hypothetical protein